MRSLQAPNVRRPLVAAGMAAGLVLIAVMFAIAANRQPGLALAVPAVLATAVFCARRPSAAFAALLVLSGSFGSLQALGKVSAGPLVDLIIASLIVSALLSHMLNARERPWWLWPGVAVLLLYVAITFLEIPTATSIGLGLKSFSYSAWYMLLVPLLALAGYSLTTYLRIYRAMIAVALLVGAYAVFRQLVGPAGSERVLAQQSAGIFNTVGGELALIGSFPNRHELAFFVTTAAPFCLAATLIDRRKIWKLAAAAAIGFCLSAAYASDVRAAIPALIAGGGTVIVLNLVSGRGRGTVLAQTMAAVAVAAAVGAFLFAVVVGPDSSRYGAILSPSGDPSYEAHIKKWQAALDDLHGHPFGKGLGTAGRLAEQGAGPFVTVGSYAIDSSYLKIVYEQGFPLLVLFAIALIALLVELIRRSVRARSPGVRALAIGAAGSLVAALSMFVTGQYMESLDSLFLWISIGAAIGAISAERIENARAESQETADPDLAPAIIAEPTPLPAD